MKIKVIKSLENHPAVIEQSSWGLDYWLELIENEGGCQSVIRVQRKGNILRVFSEMPTSRPSSDGLWCGRYNDSGINYVTCWYSPECAQEYFWRQKQECFDELCELMDDSLQAVYGVDQDDI